MLTVIRDLLRYNAEFLAGFLLTLFILIYASLHFFAPYPDSALYMLPPDMPPSGQFWFGTTSRGQDVFWQVSSAIWNTMSFGLLVTALSRVIAIGMGMTSGYLGGRADRILMSINDTFIALPNIPILLLVYFVMRDQMTWPLLAVAAALLGWTYDSRLIRSVSLGLRTREFTRHAVFAGMSTWRILDEGASALRAADHLLYRDEQPDMGHRARGHAVGAGLHGHQPADGRRNDLLGEPVPGARLGDLVVDRGADRGSGRAVPRVVHAGDVGQRICRPAQPSRPDGGRRLNQVLESPPVADRDVLRVDRLKAYFAVESYGVSREVRAVDDITFSVRRGEVYGLAGELGSGKTTLIRAVAGAIRPPLAIRGGSVTFEFGGRPVSVYGGDVPMASLRWRYLSYIMQGSMSVLNPVRRVRHAFDDFAFRHMGLDRAAFWKAVAAHLQRLQLDPGILDAYPHQLSGGMRQRTTIALATVCHPEFIIADEPTTALDVLVQRDVLKMIKDVQATLGSSIIFVTHDMSVHAAIADRIGIVYAGRLVEEAPAAELFRNPQHPYTAHLISSLPRIGDVRQRRSLDGRPPNLMDPPPGCRFHPRCPLAIDRCKYEAPPLVGEHGAGRVACWRAGEAELA